MNRRTLPWDTLALAAILASGVASWALYDQLPERVATHFDLQGNANGWMPRPMAAAFIPLLSLVLWPVTRFVPRGTEKGVIAYIAAITTLFMVVLHFVILRLAVDPASMPVTEIVFVLVGALFVALGLVLPRVKRNRFIGIRTKWALASEENWARAQRIGAYAMVSSGIVSLLAGAAGGLGGSIVAVTAILVGSLVPMLYSAGLARRIG